MSEEEKKQINIKAEISRIISENYEPANDYQEADTLKSTEDIYQHLAEHIPSEFDKGLVFIVMRELNFKEEDEGDMHFVWLIKEKV